MRGRVILEETGLYTYSIYSGMPIDFQEHELEAFLHDNRKVIEISAKISVQTVTERVGVLVMGKKENNVDELVLGFCEKRVMELHEKHMICFYLENMLDKKSIKLTDFSISYRAFRVTMEKFYKLVSCIERSF